MYLSKHISAERPHGFNTSPSTRAHLQKESHWKLDLKHPPPKRKQPHNEQKIQQEQQQKNLITVIIGINTEITFSKFSTTVLLHFFHSVPLALN